jgi:hypothetical protein
MRFVAASALWLLLAGCSTAPPPPTPTAVPPEMRALPGRGVEFTGVGSAETDEVSPDFTGTLSIGIAVVTLSHSGRSSFIVTAMQDGQSEVLTRAIGAYRGQRPLVVTGGLAFDVTADGEWSVKVQPMSSGGSPAFSGAGDLVSPFFTPPRSGSWAIAHDGSSEFVVYAHCTGGSVLVEDASGAVQEQQQVTFARGPCFWEVRADGKWSLRPAAP